MKLSLSPAVLTTVLYHNWAVYTEYTFPLHCTGSWGFLLAHQRPSVDTSYPCKQLFGAQYWCRPSLKDTSPCFNIPKTWGTRRTRQFLWDGSSDSILKWLHLCYCFVQCAWLPGSKKHQSFLDRIEEEAAGQNRHVWVWVCLGRPAEWWTWHW